MMRNMMMRKKKKLKIALTKMKNWPRIIKMKLINMKKAMRRKKNSTRIKNSRLKNNSKLIITKKQIIIKLFLSPHPQMKNENPNK